jgi:hypothetical protein
VSARRRPGPRSTDRRSVGSRADGCACSSGAHGLHSPGRRRRLGCASDRGRSTAPPSGGDRAARGTGDGTAWAAGATRAGRRAARTGTERAGDLGGAALRSRDALGD